MRHPEQYPLGWKALATEIKTANEWRCQACGVQCLRPGEGKELSRSERAKVTLTVAHFTPDYLGPAVFLMALCQPCHLRFDEPMHRAVRHHHLAKRRQAAGQTQFAFMQSLPRRRLFHE